MCLLGCHLGQGPCSDQSSLAGAGRGGAEAKSNGGSEGVFKSNEGSESVFKSNESMHTLGHRVWVPQVTWYFVRRAL